jgi:predicted DNA-binding transcriptional regulator YafY
MFFVSSLASAMKKNRVIKNRPASVSRLRLERLIAIQEYIAAGKFPNARHLAEKCDVKRDTIYDDIWYMTHRLNHPIEFDQRKNGYFYAREFKPLIAPHATEAEVEALHLLECVCELLKDIPHATSVKKTLQKITASMANASSSYKNWKNIVSFVTSVESVFDPQYFDVVFKSAVHQEELEMLYLKAGKGKKVEKRTIQVHHLAKIGPEWFIFALDAVSGKMRTFIPSRIKSVQKTGNNFKRQPFCLKERLKHSFHIFDGDKIQDVLIEFNELVADFIRDKKRRCQQGLRELDNGGVELHLRLSSLGEVHRWILEYGGDAIPTQPLELEEMLLQSGRKIVCEIEKRRAMRKST